MSEMKKAIKNAEHYLALEQKEIYLDAPPYPWELATKCEPGGTHRLGMTTSAWFSGNHPCGLSFRWSWDIEGCDANGKGYHDIDVDRCVDVAQRLLQPEARERFLAWMGECASAIEKTAGKYRQLAYKQQRDADILYTIIGKCIKEEQPNDTTRTARDARTNASDD